MRHPAPARHCGSVSDTQADPYRGLPDAALRRPSNPPWGVVRSVILTGDFAFVLDDNTGVYVEVELRAYRHRADGWEEIFYFDDVGYPDEGHVHPGWAGGYAWISGAPPLARL